MVYPNTPTLTEGYIEMMKEDGYSKEDIIKEYIDNHDTSKMREGVDYYFKRNDIISRKIYRYDNAGNRHIDYEATNNKLASAWHKLLVDQKTAYLLGSKVTFGGENSTAIDQVNEALGDDFHDVMPELSKNASNKGREWLHVYINDEGEFDFLRIPAEEGIPIYDNTKSRDLIGFIRHYLLDDGKTEKVEFWDGQEVTYYDLINGKLTIDPLIDINPEPHFYFVQGDQSKGYGWGKVPFIEFANNEERVGDLSLYKDYIDAYDLLMSDTTNTLQDIQNIFYIIKGYEDTNLSNFIDNIRRYKGVKVDADGDVTTAQASVPMEPITAQLDRFVSDIFDFGMGVNADVDKFGNAPSGVSLKNLYSYLDMKANMAERKYSKALRRLIWFVAEYYSVIPGGQTFDYKDISFTFNKSMLTNEAEKVVMAKDSKGIISDKTIHENHPWVTDVELEQERMKEQDEGAVDLNALVDSAGEGNGE